ncbi:MAG: glycosyltransferase family 2 protein [Alteromonadaceae bacterium]|nr:glycosyltransferase family 2 protein [Alteromonadaceae bacterium]
MKHLQPGNQLQRLDDKAHGREWLATGENPFFIQSKGLPAPGWQMLEVVVDSERHSLNFKVYIDTGEGFSEHQSVGLPVRSGKLCKRLFYLPFGVKALRFDPLEEEGAFTISHLRLAWLTPWFASDRLVRRLVRAHMHWRGQEQAHVAKQLKEDARDLGVSWKQLALQEYEASLHHYRTATDYSAWLAAGGERRRCPRDYSGWSYQPCVSILVPVYNPQPENLKACLDSVLAQAYPRWQLCIADDASDHPEIRSLLEEYAGNDSRIQVCFRRENGHISATTNSALEMADGEWVALLDHDDLLAPDALLEVVQALQANPDAGLVYTDEDKIDDQGERYDPHFKPRWNPDLLLAQNYISHLGVYRTDLVRAVGGMREGFEGSQDHDLVLRVTAGLGPEQVLHVPRVLYHWRAGEGSTALHSDQKDYTARAGLAAVQDYLSEHAPGARAVEGGPPNTYRVVWPLPEQKPLVSLLVPTRDRVEILQPCVDAILALTDYRNFELIILDNQSSCPDTLAYMQDVSERDERVRVLQWDEPFNYSAINNFGVRQAKGEIVGLVNNDIEPINADWLTEMVRQVLRPEVGCVGAKLYYPNETIQHAGVILGLGGVAGHSHKYFPRDSDGYFFRLHLAHNLSAVTAACLLVRKPVFEQVGGLNEQDLKVAFNDVDFCIRVREAGYRNVWTPYAELYHHESVSRGADDDPVKKARAAAEVDYMRQTWGDMLDSDPAYSPNLTVDREDFSLR